MIHPAMTKRLVICLALGAAASIICALGAPRFLPQNYAVEYADPIAVRHASWMIQDTSFTFTSDVFANAEAHARTLNWSENHPEPAWKTRTKLYSWRVLQTGFPMSCLMGWQVEYPSEDPYGKGILGLPPKTHGLYPRGGLNQRVGSFIRTESWFVYHPIWPGLLINTIVWSLPFLLIFAAASSLRRRSRRRRGLCPHCAYDLRATPPSHPCPECGSKSSQSTPQVPTNTALTDH